MTAAVDRPPRRIGRPRLGWQRLIDRHPIHAIQRIGDEEPDSDFPVTAIWNEVKALYRTGLHPAIALHVTHKGRVVMDRTLGHVHNAPGEPAGPVASPETPFSLFSASKIVTAALVMAVIEDGGLKLDDRAADYLPGFARHDKHRIRIRHLLNHTAGIPDMPALPDAEAALATGEIDLELLYGLPPQTAPGVNVAYHSLTSWFLLQEILEQVSGTDLRTLLDQRLLSPLGLDITYGVREVADADAVAKHAVTGPPVPGLMARIFDRNIGIDLERAIGFTNTPEFLTAILPSGNIIARPREIGRFMEMLRNEGELDGVRVLAPESVRRMTTEITPAQFDGTFGFPMRYGLGVMMGGNRFSLFGLGTRGAYGHLGLSNVVVYADPARELTVSFLNTGKPMMAPGMLRWYAVLQHIAARVPKTRR